MGKPVVASALPMVERTFPPGSVRGYAPGDAEALATAILALVDDPARREASVAATLEQVARAVLGARGRDALGADRAARPTGDVSPAPATARAGERDPRRIDAAVPRPIPRRAGLSLPSRSDDAQRAGRRGPSPSIRHLEGS